ncbi:MAG: class IV adenylate cyclase [Gemmatimonadota bacterium]
MRELELKAVVPDLESCRTRLEQHGGVCRERGLLRDRRFDTAERTLRARDVVLRVREFSGTHSHASVDWKGAASVVQGYKEREEVSLGVADGETAALILARLGYKVSFEIERDVDVYDFRGATIRFERYPRMDTLVEVEGTPAEIEAAIVALGIPRSAFGTGRLADFAKAFEDRTGTRAAVSSAESGTSSPYLRDDA